MSKEAYVRCKKPIFMNKYVLDSKQLALSAGREAPRRASLAGIGCAPIWWSDVCVEGKLRDTPPAATSCHFHTRERGTGSSSLVVT